MCCPFALPLFPGQRMFTVNTGRLRFLVACC